MKLSPEILQTVPFQYAADVRAGKIVCGQRITQAVIRFYTWLETADADGFHLNHKDGMFAIEFFPMFLNHTKGKLQGQPFVLAPFQQFTIYNIFAWQNADGNRRIRTVYDKRAKKNGKSAEMAGLSLLMMSFDNEMEAEVYVGATKEAQAKICWEQASFFIDSPVANPMLKKLGFISLQNKIKFQPTSSKMQPLGGDSKTQDGINAHLSIIDEYHAHATDGVKENLESSSVQRAQPLIYHITTAGVNIASVCKNYEDSVIDILEGRKKDDHIWIMIHDLDQDDDWQDESVWAKANPLLGNGLSIDGIRVEYLKAINQPSKIPNFKTKHLNMWVDAPSVWIPLEIWKNNNVNKKATKKSNKKVNNALLYCKEFGSYAGLDLSSTTDITAYVILSEPNSEGYRYLKPFYFCPEDTIDRRSKEDRVPYRQWRDAGYLISTPGNVVDYDVVEDYVKHNYNLYNVQRIERDRWNSNSMVNHLVEEGYNVGDFSQTISMFSHPTKMFEKLVYEGKILHEGDPVTEWMLTGCVAIQDTNENIRISKGHSHKGGRRIDGIIAAIMALGGSLSPKEEQSKYSRELNSDEFYI
jgi:phage terminase large subunit-like protein